MISLKKGILVSSSRVMPYGSTEEDGKNHMEPRSPALRIGPRASPAGHTPGPRPLQPCPPAAEPPSHVAVTVHAQRLDLGGLLLLVLGVDGPEQVPRGRRPGRGGRGGSRGSRDPRGPGLHSPAGRHHHAQLQPRLPASGFRRARGPTPLPGTSAGRRPRPLLKYTRGSQGRGLPVTRVAWVRRSSAVISCRTCFLDAGAFFRSWQ